MSLKQELIDFGCGPEFVEIALGYAKFYKPELDIEAFIEFVEEEYAKVEAEELKKLEDEMVDASSLFGEFESEEEL
ncbi:hypothetical protein [Sulfurimonas sp. HSL3-7]|uniref:hypothetical protein n=1 Tax=Sulfonitrofixus jiaomeiensis TaxID=3131938 RepID=UPI0031F8495E